MIENPFLDSRPPEKPVPIERWVDATVTGTAPLMIKLDGYQEVAQPPTKPPLVAGLATGDRVLCLLQGRQLVIFGRYGG